MASFQTVKGFRDFYPEDCALRNYVFETWRRVASRYGFVEYEAPVVETVTKATPAQIRKSITPEALISFEDGKPYKTLKRHLTTHGMTVAEYKAKWGLPNDYPTTAPAYSEARSAMAKALGLGQGGRKAKSPAKAPRARKA